MASIACPSPTAQQSSPVRQAHRSSLHVTELLTQAVEAFVGRQAGSQAHQSITSANVQGTIRASGRGTPEAGPPETLGGLLLEAYLLSMALNCTQLHGAAIAKHCLALSSPRQRKLDSAGSCQVSPIRAAAGHMEALWLLAPGS